MIRPLFRRLGVSENGSECIDALIQHLEPLYRPGLALLLVAHSGKDEKLGVRGSSAIEDQAGAIYELKPPEDEDESGSHQTLCTIHPRKWRAGPLDELPVLRAFWGRSGRGRLLVEPFELPNPAEERTHAIVGALTALREPSPIGLLNSRLAGKKATAAELHSLADQGHVHPHAREGKGHPLWMAGPATPECCQA